MKHANDALNYYRPNPKFSKTAKPTLAQQRQEAERRIANFHPDCQLLWITKDRVAVAQYEEIKDGTREPFTIWIYQNAIGIARYTHIPGQCLARLERRDSDAKTFTALANQLR